MARNKKRHLKTWIVTALAATLCLYARNHVSDSYIRDRVVMLNGNGVSCTGVQVRTQSGKDFILSAGHCSRVTTDGRVRVTTEDGVTTDRVFVAEDPTSDLMLVEGLPDVTGLDVATRVERLEPVRSFTHGEARPTYETLGVVIGEGTAKSLIDLDPEHCTGSKYETIDTDPVAVLFGAPAKTCVLSVEETVSTTSITHGSSGGPLLNDSGDVVGIASMMSESFSYWVKLTDIRVFLSAH